MEFNKCCRCGAFFISKGDVCPNCMPKELSEIASLKNFFDSNINPISIDDLSLSTGISAKNINRFMEQDDLSVFSNRLTNTNNIRIDL